MMGRGRTEKGASSCEHFVHYFQTIHIFCLMCVSNPINFTPQNHFAVRKDRDRSFYTVSASEAIFKARTCIQLIQSFPIYCLLPAARGVPESYFTPGLLGKKETHQPDDTPSFVIGGKATFYAQLHRHSWTKQSL